MASDAQPNDKWQYLLYEAFSNDLARVSTSLSPRVSTSLSPRVSTSLSPPQLRLPWQRHRPHRYTDSASPKGPSLTPESHRHALYSPVPSGRWRSGSTIPTSDSDDEGWESLQLKAENLRLEADKRRLEADTRRLEADKRRLEAENHDLEAENHDLRVQLINYKLFEASP